MPNTAPLQNGKLAKTAIFDNLPSTHGWVWPINGCHFVGETDEGTNCLHILSECLVCPWCKIRMWKEGIRHPNAGPWTSPPWEQRPSSHKNTSLVALDAAGCCQNWFPGFDPSRKQPNIGISCRIIMGHWLRHVGARGNWTIMRMQAMSCNISWHLSFVMCWTSRHGMQTTFQHFQAWDRRMTWGCDMPAKETLHAAVYPFHPPWTLWVCRPVYKSVPNILRIAKVPLSGEDLLFAPPAAPSISND